jgi:hypothetical protein
MKRMDTIKLAPDVVFYPEDDGEPMSEGDTTRDYLIYSVEALRLYFQSRRNIYVSGDFYDSQTGLNLLTRREVEQNFVQTEENLAQV